MRSPMDVRVTSIGERAVASCVELNTSWLGCTERGPYAVMTGAGSRKCRTAAATFGLGRNCGCSVVNSSASAMSVSSHILRMTGRAGQLNNAENRPLAVFARNPAYYGEMRG